ncbi:hypothetical protein EVG20_g9955 [Dentipellis fragilis]|uniref:Uncharacterized protein n=1 Tax=Dentipellis fragilis TaxID=205917 RepID=A0A4Y9XZ12_9AGAM|nr:hypothetical protein EVG20_g9955 [Dentipellis fragilis]
MRFFATLLSLAAIVVASQAMPAQLAGHNDVIGRDIDDVKGIIVGRGFGTEEEKRDDPVIGHTHAAEGVKRDDPVIGHTHAAEGVKRDSPVVGRGHPN